jgi:SAM-dependent methyltransferase
MNIETCVNTSDEELFRNIYLNSRKPVKWVKTLPAHDGQAVLVGGGPSLVDWIDEIRWRQSIGQTVFALNNTVTVLAANDIDIDHQVILDARESNVAFLGYAKHYYLASQCHPLLFDRVKNVTLWHQHYPDDMEQFDSKIPEYNDDYALIGGGTTVGLSTMALVYTLGFRKLHLYAYDSSYRGNALHSYPQDDPQRVVCDVTAAGKIFKSTLSMAQQAELFPKLSDMLIDAGCVITLRGDGLLQHISKMSAVKSDVSEKEKYEEMWKHDVYRDFSPGEQCIGTFIEVARPSPGSTVIDFGCGTGRASAILDNYGLNVTAVDFASNCLDVKSLNFVQADLSESIPVTAEYGYCTDVMEHIPPDKVDQTIRNIMRASGRVFFQISLVPDNCGTLIGHQLHLSVHTYEWWLAKFKELGFSVTWSDDQNHQALYYVSTT